MRKIFILIILSLFLSCSDDKPRAEFDLGEKKVSDPFCGSLKNLQRGILRQSLSWPVFNMFKPDTINHSAYLFNVTFDKESIRQNAVATFRIVDEKYIPFGNVDFYLLLSAKH